MSANTLDSLIRVISDFAEVELGHLDATSPLSNAIPGMDSLQLQELLLYLEDRFHLTLDEQVLGDINTLGELADYVAKRTPVS